MFFNGLAGIVGAGWIVATTAGTEAEVMEDFFEEGGEAAVERVHNNLKASILKS